MKYQLKCCVISLLWLLTLLLQGQVAWAEMLTVKGTGNDTYCVDDSTGKQMGCMYTNREIELFPGNYSVSLHGAKQSATVQAEQKTTLVAGIATVKGTGNDTYCVDDSTGKQMGCMYTNREIELFPGNYSVSLHGAKQPATVQAEQKTVLVAGILKIPGNGQDTYCVYDATGKQMGCMYTDREIELFSGTYTVKLNNNTQTYTVQADAPSTQVVTQPPTPTPPVVVKPCGCPPIGPAHATDKTGKTITTATKHEGGISVNDQPPVTQVTQKVSDKVYIAGNIIVDPVDVGQPVDAFVYVAVTFPWSGNLVYYYMLGPGGSILLWDQNPVNLAAFMTFSRLGAKQEIPMYSGVLPLLSTLNVFFGYRLPNGTVISNSQPINVLMVQ